MAKEEKSRVTFWSKMVSYGDLADKFPVLFANASEVIVELDASIQERLKETDATP